MNMKTYSIDELYKLVSKLEKENQKLKQTLEDLNISYDLEDVSSKSIRKDVKISTQENEDFNVDRTQLKDIEELIPDDITKPVAEKVETFLKKSGNNPYVHMNEGYMVVVRMNGEIDATEALCEYIRKRIEMQLW